MKAHNENTGRQHSEVEGIPPQTASMLSVCGSATRTRREFSGGISGNPQKQSAEEEASGSEWISSLLSSAGLPVTPQSVASRAGLGAALSTRMLALTLARSELRR